MPSGGSFHYIEPSVWPMAACAPSSRDILGHEERSFFEMLSRIETQLLTPGPHVPPIPTKTASMPSTPFSETPPQLLKNTICFEDEEKKVWAREHLRVISERLTASLSDHHHTPCVRKRILAEGQGWTSWSLGYSKGGQMSNWNNLVESDVIRSADRRDRYITSFYEGINILRDLLQKYYENQRNIIADRGDEGVVMIPGRIVWMIMLATNSIRRIVKLRKSMVDEGEEDSDYEIYSRMGRLKEIDSQRAARKENVWILREMEEVRDAVVATEEFCTGRACSGGPLGARKQFVEPWARAY